MSKTKMGPALLVPFLHVGTDVGTLVPGCHAEDACGQSGQPSCDDDCDHGSISFCVCLRGESISYGQSRQSRKCQ
jgi:hypothetical protein